MKSFSKRLNLIVMFCLAVLCVFMPCNVSVKGREPNLLTTKSKPKNISTDKVFNAEKVPSLNNDSSTPEDSEETMNENETRFAKLSKNISDVEKFLKNINQDNCKEYVEYLEKNKEIREKLIKFGAELEFFLKDGRFGKKGDDDFERAYSIWHKLKFLTEEYEKGSIGWNPVKLITNTWFKLLNRDNSNFFTKEIAREEFFKKWLPYSGALITFSLVKAVNESQKLTEYDKIIEEILEENTKKTKQVGELEKGNKLGNN